MDYLVKILSMVLVMLVKSRCSEAQSDVFEVRFFTNYIHNKSTEAAILVKIYGSVGDTIDCAIPSKSSWPEATSQFGKMGRDVYNVTVTPAIGSPTKLRVTQRDHLKQMSWNLNKVLVIDSKSFYYEFLFNRWLNSSTTAEGVISQEVALSSKYGGPRSVQSRGPEGWKGVLSFVYSFGERKGCVTELRKNLITEIGIAFEQSIGCIGNGSQVWYLDNLSNVYKPAIVASLNASNATIVTSSGHTLTVSRDQHYDGSSRPLVVNDDWLKLAMSLNHHFIAAYNQSEEFYFGTSTYVSSESLTTVISNQKYNWQHIMFHIRYADSIAGNYVRGGNIRKVDQMSTSFCTDQDPEGPYDPQALDVIFTCQNSREKIVGNVVAILTARDLMHCGMMCSRHAQCLSFNFCDSSNAACKSFPTNCELNDSQYGRKRDLEEGFRCCVLVRGL